MPTVHIKGTWGSTSVDYEAGEPDTVIIKLSLNPGSEFTLFEPLHCSSIDAAKWLAYRIALRKAEGGPYNPDDLRSFERMKSYLFGIQGDIASAIASREVSTEQGQVGGEELMPGWEEELEKQWEAQKEDSDKEFQNLMGDFDPFDH